jgi:hypothetical protein
MRGLAAALIALALCGSAHAVTIRNDNGGQLDEYWQRWLAYAQRDEWVEFAGDCASACTIYLALPNACVGRGAKFLFHAPSNPEPSDSAILNEFTDALSLVWMLNLYPPWVKAWIIDKGGLTKDQLLTMSGSYAKQFMTTCGKAGKPPNPENYLAGFHTWRVHPGGEQFINDAEERAAIALEQEAGEAALSVSPITSEPSFLPEEKPLTPMMNHPKGRFGIRKRQNFNLR